MPCCRTTAQTFLFSAHKYPREMNWTTGVLLLGFTLVMGFTSQLLRWDRTAAWSVVVAAEQARRMPVIGHWLATFILGDTTIGGGATLSQFFAIHVFLIPAFMFAFMGLHLWLVLRHGISDPPVPGKPVDPQTYRQEYHAELRRTGVPFRPDGAWRNFVFGTAVVVVIAVLAIVVGPPPIETPPDPSILEADPRPDWYLLWYFAVLAMIPERIEGLVMIAAPALIAVILLLAPVLSPHGERHWSRRPWSIGVVLFSVSMIGSLWIQGRKSPWSPNSKVKPLPANVVRAATSPIANGARLFHQRACLNCHLVEGYGGRRGPDLTAVSDRRTESDLIIRIVNGGNDMPAYANMLTSRELDAIVAFLETRRRQPVDEPAEAGKPGARRAK